MTCIIWNCFCSKDSVRQFPFKKMTFIGQEQKKSGVFEIFLRAACLLQALVRCFACDAFIDVDKVGDAVISAFCGNLTDRCVSATEQFLCLIDTRSVEILLESCSRYALEGARKGAERAEARAVCISPLGTPSKDYNQKSEGGRHSWKMKKCPQPSGNCWRG